MRSLPAILCLAAAAPTVDAQPIRVDVNLVNVAFSVHDAHGKLSGDLAAEPIAELRWDGDPRSGKGYPDSHTACNYREK
jgi:hypothetical protein